MDVGVNARLGNGIFLQGGTSTGRTTRTTATSCACCRRSVPTGVPYCHQQTNWLTQVKGLASYTIPRIDVSVAAHVPVPAGPRDQCQLGHHCARSLRHLGARLLEGQHDSQPARRQAPNTARDALNQLDLRFAKILRFGTTRTTINLDLYNATNANTILTLQQHLLTHRDDVAAADTDPAAAVLQDRRAVRFLISEAPEETPPGPTTPQRPARQLGRAFAIDFIAQMREQA